ncbi:MAG: rod shape-determining protein MreC [Proteobacteria bacterium]|jgi:rod shape-determining protein MreC|nr:rod shape-determining protein MreC [Pseudomonadota bacterium]
MTRFKFWLLIFCVVIILLDKFSFISKMRDYIAVYVQKQTSIIVYHIKNYPKLVLLQQSEQYNLESENTKLKQQVEQYSVLLKQQKNLDTDEKSLDSLALQSRLYNNYGTSVARAIIDINYLVNHKMLIDKGSGNNIEVGEAVVNQLGVIGQVSIVNNKTSQIILLANPDFKIYLQTVDSKSKMLAQGTGNNNLIVKYISKSTNIKAGDVLVTTGLDDIYPANIPVAKVIRVFYENNGFNSAICQPVVDYNKLQYIVVLKNANK